MRRKKSGGDAHRPLPEWLAVRLDISPELLSDDGIRLELHGRTSLVVRGCRHIDGYSPTRICLALKDTTLIVRGCRLICTSYLGGAVGIDGHICGISFGDDCVTELAGQEGGHL